MQQANNQHYVYQWVNINTGEIFYVGAGSKGRCVETRKGRRNSLFVEYFTNNECAVYLSHQNISLENALEIERQLVDYYWSKGWCKCNILGGGNENRVGASGELNGMYGKNHSKETRELIRELHSDGKFAGKNNPQWGVTPQERMSPEVYQKWRQKRKNNAQRGKNGRARKTFLYSKENKLIAQFDCISDCVDYLKKVEGLKTTFESLRSTLYSYLSKREEQKLFLNKYFIKAR